MAISLSIATATSIATDIYAVYGIVVIAGKLLFAKTQLLSLVASIVAAANQLITLKPKNAMMILYTVGKFYYASLKYVVIGYANVIKKPQA